MSKTVYNYDATTGVYTGTSEAQESPLEPGVYLMPANSTTIDPPSYSAGQCAIFANGAWTLETIHPAAASETESSSPSLQAQIDILETKQARPLRELVVAQQALIAANAALATAQAASPANATAVSTAEAAVASATAQISNAQTRISGINTQIEALRAEMTPPTAAASATSTAAAAVSPVT